MTRADVVIGDDDVLLRIGLDASDGPAGRDFILVGGQLRWALVVGATLFLGWHLPLDGGHRELLDG